MNKLYLLIVAVAFMSACKTKIPKDATIVSLSNHKTENIKTQSNNISLEDFNLTIPENWIQETPSNNMRVAQFALKNNPEYQVVVSYFGNMGNEVESNIKRWEGQFSQLESSSILQLNAETITAVKLLGTYKMKPFPMAQDFKETPNYGMLAAIIQTSKGPYFFKLAAPKKVIQDEEISFTEVLNSYHQ